MTEYVTKISKLTPSNVAALREARDAGAITVRALEATYAILPGSIGEALSMIQADMDQLRAGSVPVRETRYQSLIAVRNKLRDQRNVTEADLAPMSSARETIATDAQIRELARTIAVQASALANRLPSADTYYGQVRLLADNVDTLKAWTADRAPNTKSAEAECETPEPAAEVREWCSCGCKADGPCSCRPVECSAVHHRAQVVTNHTAAQAEGPLPAGPVVVVPPMHSGEVVHVPTQYDAEGNATTTEIHMVGGGGGGGGAFTPGTDVPVPVRLTIDLDVNPKMWALAFGVEGPEVLEDVATYVQNLLQCCAVVAEECWPADTVRVGAEIRDTE